MIPASGSLDNTVVSYYNAANPLQTLAGPNTTQAPHRQLCSATTRRSRSSRLGNTPPAGGIAVATLAVPAGTTQVTQAMIAAVAPSAAGPSTLTSRSWPPADGSARA